MNRHTCIQGRLCLWLGCLMSAALLSFGCAASTPPATLEQARTAYEQAQQTPQVVTQAPVALQEAEQALRRAERVWADDHDTDEVQHLAYLTLQRVAIAQKVMEKKLADVSIQKLNQQSDRVVLNARTQEAQRAQQEAEQARQQASLAASQAQAATRQAQQLQQELAALQAKQTERGMVLTLGDVLFETGKADLRAGALQNLYPLTTFLQKYPERQVMIEGHTDSQGSADSNLDLSQRRAESVQSFLLQNSIEPARVTARGYGETTPVASNTTAAGRQQNRRVEIVLP
ncbi:MAG: OmpA family protein [Candidatus Tectimicrobiota bacterium]